MRTLILTVLVAALASAASVASAQQGNIRRPPVPTPTPTPVPAPTPTPQADPVTTLKAQWEMTGPLGPTGGPRPPFTVAIAQSYTYKLYKISDPASGTVLTPVTCTTTNDAFTKTCQAVVPVEFDVPGVSVDMTAVILGIETIHSNSAVVPPALQPGAPPANFRLLRSVSNWMLRPLRGLGSLTRSGR